MHLRDNVVRDTCYMQAFESFGCSIEFYFRTVGFGLLFLPLPRLHWQLVLLGTLSEGRCCIHEGHTETMYHSDRIIKKYIKGDHNMVMINHFGTKW